ncbi:hypothetical protein LUZ61_005731 [Rhynchospora tenuis]|uniref:glutathione transferase n=1 Tax=Rhynchospora tenuis TaxID=198213 RepID=A0AAD6EUV2_9POAL|nr:hypothetical protein LUZ61_005731 [Rhynchospora tenuis]
MDGMDEHSTAVARVLVCLEEVGAEYEIVPIDFTVKEYQTPAHIARNPFGQVPAFQDDDFVIFESSAISRYILSKYKSNLLPEDDLRTATMVNVWLDVEYGQYNTPISTIIYDLVFKPMMGTVPDQQIVDANLENFKKVLKVYEARLSQCKYLAGDFISFADLSHFPYTYYFAGSQYGSLFNSYPHLKAWWEDLMSRPSHSHTEVHKTHLEKCCSSWKFSINFSKVYRQMKPNREVRDRVKFRFHTSIKFLDKLSKV